MWNHRHHWFCFRSCFVSAGMLLTCLSVGADEKPDSAATKSEEGSPVKRATVKVEKTPLSASVSLKGVVEGDKTSGMAIRLKAWTGPLIVEKAVEHGTPVKPGDLLISFEAEKLQQAIRDAREERELAQLAIRHAELELPTLKKQLPLDLEAAERDQKQAAEDLKRFLTVEKQHEIDTAQHNLKGAEFNLDYSREELVQLEKMYRDKDLTEETEQMILKRYQFQVEQSEFSLRSIKLQTERSLNIDLPRREEAGKLAATKTELALSRARELLPVQLKQKELALKKLRFDDNRAKDKLADLEQDLSRLTIKSPAEGVAYTGRYARGQWSGPPGNAYLHGSTMAGNEVIFTIISKGPLFIRADVEEKEVAGLKVGQAARVSPTSTPDKKLAGRVLRISPVPQGGKFELVVALDDQSAADLVPGMTCSIRILTDRRESTLAVPASAVFEDADAETLYVYIQKYAPRVVVPGAPPDKGSLKPEKRTVKVGLRTPEKIEILEGLAEEDEILAAKP